MTSNLDRAELLSSALRAIVDCDRSELVRLLTRDVRVWTPELSTATRDELIEALRRRDDAFSDVAIDVVPLDVGGDHACAEWAIAMKHTGTIEFANGTTVEPTGLVIELHGATVAEFLGAEICSLRQYWNENSLLEQLGVVSRGV